MQPGRESLPQQKDRRQHRTPARPYPLWLYPVPPVAAAGAIRWKTGTKNFKRSSAIGTAVGESAQVSITGFCPHSTKMIHLNRPARRPRLEDQIAMSEHTPEPWHHNDTMRSLKGPDGDELYLDGGRHPTNRYPLASENSARIVACVNACAGIPTEQLQEGSVAKLVEALETLHKEAREALIALVGTGPASNHIDDQPAMKMATDALAPFLKGKTDG